MRFSDIKILHHQSMQMAVLVYGFKLVDKPEMGEVMDKYFHSTSMIF